MRQTQFTGQQVNTLLLLIFILFLIAPARVYAQEKGLQSENRLFHIERSKNRNLVCYDVNLEDGKLNVKKPLDIYWVNQEEKPGQVNTLSGIEKKFAYGYKLLAQKEDASEVSLTAYPGRNLTIQKQDEKYVCTIIINGQPAILQKLYVQAKASNSLSVEYVELTGLTIATNEPVLERVENGQK